jgi:hypothetical protein
MKDTHDNGCGKHSGEMHAEVLENPIKSCGDRLHLGQLVTIEDEDLFGKTQSVE